MKHLQTFLTITALGVIANAAEAATTLRLACPSAATNPTCMAAEEFAAKANELSGGSLDVQVFPAGQLGRGAEAIQQMQAGIIDLVVEDITNYGNFVTDYNVISWGFTFRDEAHFKAFLTSDVEARMADQLREQFNLRFLSVEWAKLPRVVVSTKPVFTPDDLKGLKFRVPGIPSYIKTWEALGANPTSVPWGEAFQALKTGVTDAMESPLDSIVAQKFHLAAPYVTLTNHVFPSITLAINETRFQGLTAEEQAALTGAAELAAEYSEVLAAEVAETAAKQITDDGGFVIMVNSEPFQAKLADQTAVQEQEGLWAAGLMDEIRAME
ncbi:TRAP transporter substrate-binding protein [Tropicimonas sp. IMCC6043]|uniref:TRAP transporter substrate-binding protein n=1 Tax=Tropicimonas sp. IMCC6043 TaxID=2510645 RepID=UPI00101DB9AE|nr:TRAP transporter substrate-binding protein [Tropicimonas sp. IMCC6043]RYH11348.1 TRAP transporter substrate-binding protein [Tropicimonas sp. IMCC6043]